HRQVRERFVARWPGDIRRAADQTSCPRWQPFFWQNRHEHNFRDLVVAEIRSTQPLKTRPVAAGGIWAGGDGIFFPRAERNPGNFLRGLQYLDGDDIRILRSNQQRLW